MKATLLQELFSKNLSLVSRFTSIKAQLPVLSNILIKAKAGKIIFDATNLETSIHTGFGSKVTEDGEITIPAKIITEIVNNLPKGQIDIETEGEKVILKSSNFESTILGMNSSDFPKVPDSLGKHKILIRSKDLKTAINKVLFAVSTDETRPVLTGVLIILSKDEIVLVSTDGFRLSQKRIKQKTDIPDEVKVIIPKNAIGELIRISENFEEVAYSFSKEENQVVFQAGEIVLSSRIIQGDFPDFERIIPKSKNICIEVGREEFAGALKLASVFARDSAGVVRLNVFDNLVKIRSESSQSGSQETSVDAKVEKELKEFVIAYNYKYIEEFLSCCEGDEIKMEFSDVNAPGVFLDPKDSDFLHIIMPVRIND